MRSRNVVVGSNKSSECVFVALGSQHATCMRRFILSSVAYTALQYFSTLFHERYDFMGQTKGYLTQYEYILFDFLQKIGLKHFSF